jgi:heat shock protein HslJ
MKVLYITCIGLLVLALLATGCTSQPAPIPATTAAPVAPSAAATPAAAAPPTLTGTTWTLGWFDDTNGVWSKVAEGSTITATFLNEGKVTGSGGCNGYSVNFHLGDSPRIYIVRPVVPDRLCQTPVGVMSQESYYFSDLGNAETYSITNNQLLIFNRDGRKILQFDPS